MRRLDAVRVVAAATVIVSCGASGASAQAPARPQPAAATQRGAATATTAPTSAPVDLMSPKGALKSLAKALEAGDRQGLLDLLQAENPDEQKIAAATADLAEASAELRRASVKTFGEEASRVLGVNAAAVPEAYARIDGSAVTNDGPDRAVVASPEDAADTITLVRRDAKWRVPVSQISGPVGAADVDRSVRDVAAQTKLLRDVAGEVGEGKFKTAVDARQELDKRIMRSAMPQLSPSTGPGKSTTTAPATAPAAPR